MTNISIFEWNNAKSKIKQIREEIDSIKQQHSIDGAKNKQLTSILQDLAVLENMVNNLIDQQKDNSTYNKIKRILNKERF